MTALQMLNTGDFEAAEKYYICDAMVEFRIRVSHAYDLEDYSRQYQAEHSAYMLKKAYLVEMLSTPNPICDISRMERLTKEIKEMSHSIFKLRARISILKTFAAELTTAPPETGLVKKSEDADFQQLS